jgi:RimJ/RimL family protein N-acetyltransferase
MTFNEDFKEKIRKIKYSKINSESTIYFNHLNAKYILYPITKKIISEKKTISLLALWRKNSQKNFPSQFRITFAGTKKWAHNQLLEKDDRVLFFLRKENNKLPFAHMGLYRLDSKNKSCEIDNVIRGKDLKNTKGAMTVSLLKFIEWTYQYFKLRSLTLTVFEDNKRAIKLYEQIGFKILKKIPLEPINGNDGSVIWEETTKKNAKRYFIKMIHVKNE